MIWVLVFIKADADRNALHHFYVIASGVFRRQQTEPGPGCAAYRFNSATKFAAISVNLDLGWLSHFHVTKLCLFKVGGGPDVIQVHNGKQWLPGLHGLSG